MTAAPIIVQKAFRIRKAPSFAAPAGGEIGLGCGVCREGFPPLQHCQSISLPRRRQRTADGPRGLAAGSGRGVG
jgi:hypothetical protein